MWNTTTLYFVKKFSGKRPSENIDILMFKPRFDLVAHIQHYENEWRKACYRDERVWPHMFPNALDDIHHKWYKIEEAYGHTFDWNEIKNNFLKNFEFKPEEALLQDEQERSKIS
jgi:hypothetical protein